MFSIFRRARPLKFKMIGVIRFSVLTPTYYSERFATIDETAAHIFSPERMELRFRLFEHLCLRSLLSQTDDDFHAIIITAKRMPREYKERLAALVTPHRNLRLRFVGTENHYQLLRDAYGSVSARDSDRRIHFRLDDDDAVDNQFIARTRQIAQHLAAAQAHEDTPFIIAYNRGLYAKKEGAECRIFDTCERAPLSVGTSLVAPQKARINPYRFNHRKFAQHFNTYSDISVPGFLRTIHGDNKSNPAQLGLINQLTQEEIGEALKQHFDLSLASLTNIL